MFEAILFGFAGMACIDTYKEVRRQLKAKQNRQELIDVLTGGADNV